MKRDVIEKFTKRHSIKSTYVTYIVAFTIIPCIILMPIIYSISVFTVKEEYANDYISSVNAEYESRMNMVFQHFNRFMLNLSTHHELYSTILDTNISEEDREEKIQGELRAFLKNEETVVGIEIQTERGLYSYFKDEVDLINAGVDITENYEKTKLYIDKNIILHGDKRYLRIGKCLINFYSGTNLGNVTFYVNEELLSEVYIDSLIADDKVFIMVDDVVCSNHDKIKIGSVVTEESAFFEAAGVPVDAKDNFLMNSYPIGTQFLKNNVNMVSVLSTDRVIGYVSGVISKIFFAILGFMVASIIIALRLSASLTSNIRKLTMRMGDFEKNMQITKLFKRRKKHTNEITSLEDSFDKMLIEIKTLISQNEENSEKRRKAELSALQAQINPHFLYNVLDIISWLAKMEHQELIEKMVAALSNFYRMGLHNGQDIIPIRDEIEHVKNYIFLQEVRFPDTFSVEFDIDEDILDIHMIKIILQPLVENAIKHGFSKKSSGGVIKICGRKEENGYVRFCVSDNGCGIIGNPLDEKDGQSQGYGAKNVNERLIMAYGKECGLLYESVPGEGTKVSFMIKTTPRATDF